MQACECGCGESVKNRFVRGHRARLGPWNKGLTKDNSESIRKSAEKVSQTLRSMTKENSEWRRRQAASLQGKPAWNRGLSQDTDMRIKRNADTRRGQVGWTRGLSKETSEGIRKTADKLRGRTKETHEYIRENAKKVSEALQGRPSKLRGRTKETHEHIRAQIIKSKQKWTPERRAAVREKMLGENNFAKRPEVRKKIGKAKIGMSHTAVSKYRMSEAHKGKKLTEEHKIKLREFQCGKTKDNTPWRRVAAAGISAAWGAYPEEKRITLKQQMSERMKGTTKDKCAWRVASAKKREGVPKSDREVEAGVRSRAAKRRLKYTRAERLMQGALDRRGVLNLHNEPVGRYEADFLLYGLIVVELDGYLWHSTPHMAAHDKKKNQYLEERGYLVIRLRDDDVLKDVNACVDIVLTKTVGWLLGSGTYMLCVGGH